MQITEFKKIGKGRRFRLFVDGEDQGEFEAEILAKYALRTGQEIEEELLKKLKSENADYSAFQKGLSCLEKGMKTEKGVRDYLRQKGFDKPCVEKTVAKLKNYGYIDDSVFAENFIRTYSSSKGKKKIKYELLQKGVKEEVVVEKLAEILDEDEEFETAKRLCKKYIKTKKQDPKLKQKAVSNLVSKGFSFDVSLKALKDCLEDEDESWD